MNTKKTKTENRTCAYCGAAFDIKSRLPYYSCPECRSKESHDRLLVYKQCEKCGIYFSTSPWTRFCRSCVASNRHELSKATRRCDKCGKPILNTGDTICVLCRKNEALLSNTRKCVYCGTQLPGVRGAKTCKRCEELIAKDGKSGKCVNCGNRFAMTNTQFKFCCNECEAEWNKKHGTKSRSSSYRGVKSVDVLMQAAYAYIEKNPNATRKDLLNALHISVGTADRKGIKITDIKNALGIVTKKSSSYFEQDICHILDSMGIKYVREKYFNDLKDKRYLRYDFYIEELNLLLEADGGQHYKENFYLHFKNGGKNLPYNYERLWLHDAQKNEYARRNGYNLLRVHYFRFYEKQKVAKFQSLIKRIQCVYRETGKLELFNCWNGSELIPISSQAPRGEGSETIP